MIKRRATPVKAELRNYHTERHYLRIRLGVLGFLVLSCFAALAVRFYYLQIVKYQHYQTLAESNRISIVPITPNRGLITDSKGRVLAQNFFAYALEITPSKVDDLESLIAELATVVSISPGDLKRFKKLKAESHAFESVPIRTYLNEVEAARFAANRYRFDGVEIKSRLYRQYPLGARGAHIVGYISRINDKDLEKLEKEGDLSNYKGTDHIGKSGIEQSYEHRLHGITGYQQVEIDSHGKAVRVLSSKPPTPGENITLAIDFKLQEIAENAFGDKRGALVAIKPETGEVLAFVSMPTFNPNLFVNGIDSENWKSLNNSIDRPLINRPLRGIYPPGSTFKPFAALAGLEDGRRSPPYAISDPGFFVLPNSSHRYRDWKPSGHGLVDIRKAITISCDTFFYGLAMEMGIEKLGQFVRQFGFGEKSQIDLPGEVPGLFPSPDWKQRRFKQPWYKGETVIVGIGQGYTLTTPLQLAQATAIFANRGKVISPHLVNGFTNPKTAEFKPFEIKVREHIPLKPQNIQIVKEGMLGVTQPGGTAAAVGANAGYLIAAKTGTAQVIGIKQNEKYNEKNIDERHRDHALFVAYAPADDPKIALGVIVENGGHGGSAAGPIARKVMDYYLLGKIPQPASAKTDAPTANTAAGAPTATADQETHDHVE